MLITDVPATSSLATCTQDIAIRSSSPPWHLLYKNELIFRVTYFRSYELHDWGRKMDGSLPRWQLADMFLNA